MKNFKIVEFNALKVRQGVKEVCGKTTKGQNIAPQARQMVKVKGIEFLPIFESLYL